MYVHLKSVHLFIVDHNFVDLIFFHSEQLNLSSYYRPFQIETFESPLYWRRGLKLIHTVVKMLGRAHIVACYVSSWYQVNIFPAALAI